MPSKTNFDSEILLGILQFKNILNSSGRFRIMILLLTLNLLHFVGGLAQLPEYCLSITILVDNKMIF